MEVSRQRKAYIMVTMSGVLWGAALLFSQYILDNGIGSRDLVSLKMFFGLMAIGAYTYYKDKNLLKIDKKGLAYGAAMGLIAHTLFNLFMFRAIERTSIATTVALMYTSPIFVMVFSRFLFQEKFTKSKLAALVFCIVGVALTVTGGDLREFDFNFIGILYGLATGICYGIMNVLSKILEDKYSQLTMLTYTLGFAFIFSLSFSNPLVVFQVPFNIWLWLSIFILGAFATALSYLLFITGLAYGVESSKASIIISLEVPVSVIGSYFIFGQDVGGLKVLGIVLVLLSIVILGGAIDS